MKKTDNNFLENQTAFSQKIGTKAEHKLKARNNPKAEIWFGLGMMDLSDGR